MTKARGSRILPKGVHTIKLAVAPVQTGFQKECRPQQWPATNVGERGEKNGACQRGALQPSVGRITESETRASERAEVRLACGPGCGGQERSIGNWPVRSIDGLQSYNTPRSPFARTDLPECISVANEPWCRILSRSNIINNSKIEISGRYTLSLSRWALV